MLRYLSSWWQRRELAQWLLELQRVMLTKNVRSTLAQLGYEKLDDIIGHTEVLRPQDISLVKTQHLDLGYVLSNVGFPKWSSSTIRKHEVHSNGPVLDDILLSDVEVICWKLMVEISANLPEMS